MPIKIVSVFILALFCHISVAGVRFIPNALKINGPAGTIVSREPARNSAAAPQESTELKAIVLQLRPQGFTPKEVVLAQGGYLLVVKNRTGLDVVTLRLERVAGERVYDVIVPRRRGGWKQLVQLMPGQYVLSEASHPEWGCRFTINSR